MRQLTKTQKKLLTKWYNTDNSIFSWADLSTEQIEQLEQINNTEILYQEVNRFIWDLKK